MPAVNGKNCRNQIRQPKSQDGNVERSTPNLHLPDDYSFGRPDDQRQKQPKIKIDLFFKRQALESEPREKERQTQEEHKNAKSRYSVQNPDD